MLWMCQNGIDLVEVSIFYKLEKTSGQKCLADKDKYSSAFISYHSRIVLELFCSIYYALDISSPKTSGSA